jgi:hypothetical protein
MPLPFRPAPLILFAVLLGAGSVAMASPQQQSHRRGDRPPPMAQGQGSQDDGGSRRAPQQRPDWTPPQPRRNEDGLSDSVRRVEQRTRGQELSAEPVPYDGRNLNRIKVVDERGRVRVYMDDPQQGSQRSQDSAPTRDNDD